MDWRCRGVEIGVERERERGVGVQKSCVRERGGGAKREGRVG